MLLYIKDALDGREWSPSRCDCVASVKRNAIKKKKSGIKRSLVGRVRRRFLSGTNLL